MVTPPPPPLLSLPLTIPLSLSICLSRNLVKVYTILGKHGIMNPRWLTHLGVLKSSRTSSGCRSVSSHPLNRISSTAVLDQAPGCHSNLSAHPFSWDCHSLIIGPAQGGYLLGEGAQETPKRVKECAHGPPPMTGVDISPASSFQYGILPTSCPLSS